MQSIENSKQLLFIVIRTFYCFIKGIWGQFKNTMHGNFIKSFKIKGKRQIIKNKFHAKCWSGYVCSIGRVQYDAIHLPPYQDRQ